MAIVRNDNSSIIEHNARQFIIFNWFTQVCKHEDSLSTFGLAFEFNGETTRLPFYVPQLWETEMLWLMD